MPASLRPLRRALLWLFGHVMPGAAARAFERAILRPHSPVGGGPTLPLPPGGKAFRVPHGDGTLAAHVWNDDGSRRETALLVHGWGSSMSRLARFVEPLASAGYRVLAYDHPAHGASDGDRTTMIACARALLDLGRQLGPIDAVIAHSFGGPTAALAATTGLPYRRLVLLAPPLDMIEQTIEAGVMLGVPRHVAERMARDLSRRLGVAWSELKTDHLIAQLDVPTLVVHDRDDPIAPFSAAEVVAAAARDGRMIATEGLGHRDLLVDPGVHGQVLAFLRETATPSGAPLRQAAPDTRQRS